MEKLVNGINAKVQSTDIGEGNENLLNFCVHSENARKNERVIVYYHV